MYLIEKKPFYSYHQSVIFISNLYKIKLRIGIVKDLRRTIYYVFTLNPLEVTDWYFSLEEHGVWISCKWLKSSFLISLHVLINLNSNISDCVIVLLKCFVLPICRINPLKSNVYNIFLLLLLRHWSRWVEGWAQTNMLNPIVFGMCLTQISSLQIICCFICNYTAFSF